MSARRSGNAGAAPAASRRAQPVLREPEINELTSRHLVSRSGTAGSAAGAHTREAVSDLADAVELLPSGAQKNDVIRALNRMMQHYDQLIVHYAGKRDALTAANKLLDGLHAEVQSLKSAAMEEKKALLDKLTKGHKGCACTSKMDGAGGKCNGTCGCSRDPKVPCGPHCSCNPAKCENRGGKKQAFDEEQVDQRRSVLVERARVRRQAAIRAEPRIRAELQASAAAAEDVYDEDYDDALDDGVVNDDSDDGRDYVEPGVTDSEQLRSAQPTPSRRRRGSRDE